MSYWVPVVRILRKNCYNWTDLSISITALLRPEQNDGHFAENLSHYISATVLFLIFWLMFHWSSLKVCSKTPIVNKLVWVMTWCMMPPRHCQNQSWPIWWHHMVSLHLSELILTLSQYLYSIKLMLTQYPWQIWFHAVNYGSGRRLTASQHCPQMAHNTTMKPPDLSAVMLCSCISYICIWQTTQGVNFINDSNIIFLIFTGKHMK